VAVLGVCWLAYAVATRTAGREANVYAQKILVANRPGFAPDAIIDKHLLNPWGIALRPPGAGGHFWISNAGNFSTSTYVGDVHGTPLHQDGLKVVYFESPLISYEDGLANVTGQVYNAASDLPEHPIEFPVSGEASNLTSGTAVPIGSISGAAKFVFVTTEGTVHAWRASTAESMNRAVIVKDYSDHGRDQIKDQRYLSAFTGVAMSTNAEANNRLYVTDFQNKVIRVLDHVGGHHGTRAVRPAAWNSRRVQPVQHPVPRRAPLRRLRGRGSRRRGTGQRRAGSWSRPRGGLRPRRAYPPGVC